jgi:hypothetical protein
MGKDVPQIYGEIDLGNFRPNAKKYIAFNQVYHGDSKIGSSIFCISKSHWEKKKKQLL